MLQWAGVSLRSVINCTNRVMVAILNEHDTFISLPPEDSEDMEKAHAFMEKSRYSLNCQAAIMPHNLLIVDYGLGYPGSVYDAWAFQGTCMVSNPAAFILRDHWTWADSMYLTETCLKEVGCLTRNQNIYNHYLSKICVHVEHAFAALNGRFQSLCELQLQMRTKKDIHIVLYWIMCCMVLHNMILCFEERQAGAVELTMKWAIVEG
ncbi:hypothetical protein BDN67DRAFT_991915 [Paxillus ammoniavirescens]|nr:hypothetical protein BDN67DRAFT_991915 [Paxillus ammoniavirescens]